MLLLPAIMKRIVNRYQSLSLPLKATFWFTLANFLIKGISFITVPLFTKYLSTEEYGIVSVYLSYQQILLIFATFEMSQGAYMRGILKYKDSKQFFTFSEQALSTLVTVIVFFISLTFKKWFIQSTEINNAIYNLMFIYFLFYPSYQCWVNYNRFTYNYKPVVLMSLLYAFITTVIPLLAIVKLSATAVTRIYFMLLCEIIVCAPFYFINVQLKMLQQNRKLVFEQWKFIILFQAPSIVHSLSFLILGQADRMMIGMMVGKSYAGIYSVAYSLASVISILNTSVNQVFKPWRYQKMEDKEYNKIKSTSTTMLLLFGTLILCWILIAPEFMKLLFNKSYYDAIWTIPPVSMSVFFVFLYSMFVDIEEYFCKTKYTMYATLICSVLNIILNYFGIITIGYIACSYTTLICYILFAVLHGFWSNKASSQCGIHIYDIFNVKLILILSGILLAMELLLTFMYHFTIIRYIVLLGIIVLFMKFRKGIMSALAELKQK